MATYDDMLKSARQQAFFQGLMGLGAGMLQGGDPRQPQSFGAGLGRGMQGYSQNYNDTFATQLQSEMARMKYGQMQREQQKQDTQQGAMAALMGGMDPRTGINWNTGREGMSPQQEMGLLAQASPETALKRMYPEPQKPVSVAPGASLVDPTTGQPIYSAPPRDTAREAQVKMLTDTGVPAAVATGIAAGRYAVSRDPVTGVAQIVDKATGSLVFNGGSAGTGAPPISPTPQDGQQQPVPTSTLWDMAEQGGVTGILPGATSAAQGITGQLGINVASEKLLEQRQTFATAKNDLIRSLSINPRFPVSEMERIANEINIEPGMATDKRTLQSRMRSVDEYLRGRLTREQAAARDASLPAETRQNAATAAKDINNFLGVMGVPPRDGGGNALNDPLGIRR